MIYYLHLQIFNCYIYTPLTLIHQMNILQKVYITILALIVIPYQDMVKITISIVTCICFFTYLRYKSYCHKTNFILLIFGIYSLLKTKNIYQKFISNIYLNISKKNNINIIYLTIRTNLIIIINMLIIQILLCTTIYEKIITYTIYYSQLIYCKKRKCNPILAITSFSCQFLERISIYLNNKNHGIKIRNPQISLINHWQFFIIYIFHHCIQYIKKEVMAITCICYTRDINISEFKCYIF
uniref:Transmembrane protein n=1 Tax=Gastroclonium compressum TaxID=1852973 RepID=A0A173G000_GASCM|nr:hypothetical protein [Coeloseira compressa]ANH09605.1 hypothetical protein [Coeloseira compressa]